MEEQPKIEKIEKIDGRKNNGGARKGAGMKLGAKIRKTIRKEAAQMYLIRRVEEEIEGITKALLDKAKGKDIPAIKEALDRAWGKSREKHDVSVTYPTPILSNVPKNKAVEKNA